MMKKITKLVTLLLALAMVFSLAACSSGKGKDKADGSADIATLIATEPNSVPATNLPAHKTRLQQMPTVPASVP